MPRAGFGKEIVRSAHALGAIATRDASYAAFVGVALVIVPLQIGRARTVSTRRPRSDHSSAGRWPSASQRHFEPVHKWTLPREGYRALVAAGALGYQRVLAAQAPSLFTGRPVTLVNPPVQLLARRDRIARSDPMGGQR